MSEPETLDTRKDLHLPRRLFHFLSGIIIVLIASQLESRQELFAFLATGTLILLGLDYLRIRSKWAGELGMRLFGKFMRRGEEGRISGAPFYAIGCTMSVAIFPREVAMLAILYLSVGDPIASLAGNLFGKRSLPENLDLQAKSWEGSIACFVACAVVTYFVAPFYFESLEFHSWQVVAMAVIGGLGAAIAEIFPLRTDDNLTLPVISGSFLWISASLLELIPGLYF